MIIFCLLIVVSVVVFIVVLLVVLVQQKMFYVVGYGGLFEKMICDEVILVFEKENGVKVEYVVGNFMDMLVKLQVQKGNQQIDVVIVDDGLMYQVIQFGFCGKFEGLLVDFYDIVCFKDDYVVVIGIVVIGLMYNIKVFKEKGWVLLMFWNDLKDLKYVK